MPLTLEAKDKTAGGLKSAKTTKIADIASDLIAKGAELVGDKAENQLLESEPIRRIMPSASSGISIPSGRSAGAGLATRKSGARPGMQPADSYGLWGSRFGFGRSQDDDDDVNDVYEDYFTRSGMSDEDMGEIGSRGSWFDVHSSNPTADMVVSGLGQNPFAGVTMDDLREGMAREINSLAETGGLTKPENLPEYDNANDIGGIDLVDDGRTMDYGHLTADRVTGSAMQKYGELGMGGRGWWEYDPESLYTKSDEAQDFGFKPYLSDETSRANLFASQLLDAPSDLVGALASSRELATDYSIGYDRGEGQKPLEISGSDWDYRAKPYINNMRRLMAQDPASFLTMPEGGEVHGAPVTTMVLEHQIQDADGNTRYAYGDLVDGGFDLILSYGNGDEVAVPSGEYAKWGVDDEGYLVVPDEYQGDIVGSRTDDNLHLRFGDGQDIYVPESVYGQPEWHDVDGGLMIPDAEYVPMEQTRGFVPEDLDALNASAIERGTMQDAPVLYVPDLVMDDGTRVNWRQAQDIYYDAEPEDNPDLASDDAISYDFGPLDIAKPRRMSNEILDDIKSANLPGILTNAYDYTMSSLPISFDKVAWPISVSQGLSKSFAGIDPGKYDALTGSDSYISADLDDEGNISPTYTDSDMWFNAAGNMLVPLTEQIVGPIGGNNPMIKKLSNKLPSNPTVGQVWRSFGEGALGEGLEEIGGNLFEEATNQGPMMFGDVVTPEGERLLDDWGNPAVDENGEYRFTDANGRPYEYMTDETGHVYKSADTPFARRVANFLNPEDIANAFLGGVLVDAAMQLPTTTLPATYRAARNDRNRRDTGVRQYVDTERDELRREAAARGEEFDPRQGDIEIDPTYARLFDDPRLFDDQVRRYEE